MTIPINYEPYTDIYFLRSLEILKKMDCNPVVRMQVFFRGEPGKIYGIKEVIELIESHSQLISNNGKIFHLPEGSEYSPGETVLLIEGKIQDIIFLETIILGVLSAETTTKNDAITINYENITQRINDIVKAVNGRQVFYFGARHWRYDMDEFITRAAFDGGVSGASTNIGARTNGKTGIGTIPHSLENIFSWIYGKERAVVETTKAFDRIIDKGIPRIALVDYANKEVDDSLNVAQELQGSLSGIRIDTCGENVMQGALEIGEHNNRPYWYGKGVTISGVYNLKKKLNASGLDSINITLSSGFGNLAKVQAFVDAEIEMGLQLFDSLGVGNIFDMRISTMDIVGVGSNFDTIEPVAKTGRKYNPNNRLKRYR